MKLRLCFIFLFMLSLSACTTRSEQSLNTDLKQNICCTSFAQLPLEKLIIPAQQRIIMDGERATITNHLLETADSAKQQLPTMAYRIDEQQNAFNLSIRAYINQHTLFAPRILVFDDHWQLLSDYRYAQFKYQPAGLQGLERIETEILIEPQKSSARYILIVADTSLLKTKVERMHLEALYAQKQQVIGNKQLPLYATFESSGVIDVTTTDTQNNAISSLFVNLGLSKNRPLAASSLEYGEKSSAQSWAYYKQKIDQSLAKGDVKNAAKIAKQADEKQIPEAKNYLLQQLTE